VTPLATSLGEEVASPEWFDEDLIARESIR